MTEVRELDRYERAARAYRRELGLEHRSYMDPMTLLVKTKHADPSFDYCRVPDGALGPNDGSYDSERNTISLTESVFRGMNAGVPRARMTVAHELSHYRWQHKGTRHRSSAAVQAIEGIARKRDEQQAKQFAPIFLAPEYLVPEEYSVSLLMERFGLSRASAEIRADEIRKVRGFRNRKKRPLSPRIKQLLSEAKESGLKIRTEIEEGDK